MNRFVGVTGVICFFITMSCNHEESPVDYDKIPKAGLLLTDFRSLDELKEIIDFSYGKDSLRIGKEISRGDFVELVYRIDNHELKSFLKPGVSENSFNRARRGSWMDKCQLVFASPYAIWHRKDLLRAEILSRRREHLFGEGDVAFYDIAENMVYNIVTEDLYALPPEALSEKGYLNTFNHVVAQAFITTILSETLADFIADVHERSRIPELISGEFTREQLLDLENGPVDNYIDMINNEWGQELGKLLKHKYSITSQTHWTPGLLSAYLNDLLSYHAWVFGIGFKPFRENDQMVTRFANKINMVIEDLDSLMEV